MIPTYVWWKAEVGRNRVNQIHANEGIEKLNTAYTDLLSPRSPAGSGQMRPPPRPRG